MPACSRSKNEGQRGCVFSGAWLRRQWFTLLVQVIWYRTALQRSTGAIRLDSKRHRCQHRGLQDLSPRAIVFNSQLTRATNVRGIAPLAGTDPCVTALACVVASLRFSVRLTHRKVRQIPAFTSGPTLWGEFNEVKSQMICAKNRCLDGLSRR